MDGWMDHEGKMDERKLHGRMDVDEWMGKWMVHWMYGWMDGCG